MFKRLINRFIDYFKRPRCTNGHRCAMCKDSLLFYQDGVATDIICTRNAR